MVKVIPEPFGPHTKLSMTFQLCYYDINLPGDGNLNPTVKTLWCKFLVSPLYRMIFLEVYLFQEIPGIMKVRAGYSIVLFW